MRMDNYNIGGRGGLCAVGTDKFKRNNLFLTRLLDIDPASTPHDIALLQVLGRKTADYPSKAELGRRCEELYGAAIDGFVNFVGDRQIMVLCCNYVSDAVMGGGDEIVRGVLGVLSSIWTNPLLQNSIFPADEVARVKQALCNDIRAADNDPAGYAARRCREMACEGSPCGYTVTVEDVERITPESLTARYHELVGGRFGAFYVGDAPEQMSKLLLDYFGGYIGEFTALAPHPIAAPCESVRRVDEPRAVVQGKLCMAFHGAPVMSDSDEYYATLMAVEIFGASPVAKLFTNVRERLGLCYYCSASYNKFGGIVYVSSGVAPEKRLDAEREILVQLEQLKSGNITDAELSAARLSLINSARQIEDRPYSVRGFLEYRLRMGLDCSIERHIERIASVGVDEIKRAASSWRLSTVYFLSPDGGAADGEEDEYDS